ncbi:MAG: hypothetical protein RMK62_09865 [Armatimonadota bacterium]|nr:hypothetical protein [Armatimonadota bacterium]
MNRLLIVLAIVAALMVGGVIWMASRPKSVTPTEVTPAGAQEEQRETVPRYQEK